MFTLMLVLWYTNHSGDNMIYLKKFNLLNENAESNLINGENRTYVKNRYPCNIFPERGLENIEFDTITFIYGGNGSGKSTVLNIIAEAINAQRERQFGKGEMFTNYIKLCNYEFIKKPSEVKIISSDDVFEYLFNIRRINYGIYDKREDLFNEYFDKKYNSSSIKDYEELVNAVDAKKMSLSKFVKKRVPVVEMPEQSNGESALMYFAQVIKENGLYILDEPENSMSASMQIKLAHFLEDSARFFNCQFIIATHSPFLLNIKYAKIYDLDSYPARVKKYSELENVRIYYNFFKENAKDFEEK